MKQILITMLMIGKLFATGGTIMIEVAYEGENYKITKAWKIDETFPPTMNGIVKSKDDIIIELKDKNGKIVDELRIENPRVVRGIFPEIGNEEGHENIKKEKGSFVLRYSYAEGLKYLNIINVNHIEENAKYAPSPKKKIEISNDMEFGSLLK